MSDDDYRRVAGRDDRAVPWSATTWGIIAGLAIVVLLLIITFATQDGGRNALEDKQSTVGQRQVLPGPPDGVAGERAPAPRP